MTTEEFEGHLLACLHGPSGPKIANKVLEHLLNNQTVVDTVAEVVAQSKLTVTALAKAVFPLQVLALLDVPDMGETAKLRMERIGFAIGLRAGIKEELCTRLDELKEAGGAQDEVRIMAKLLGVSLTDTAPAGLD